VRWNVPDQELAQLQQNLQDEWPDLVVLRHQGRIVAEGRVALFANGEIVDDYGIRVVMPLEGTGDQPQLFELGGRIPRTHDRHIDDNCGKCCVMATDEFPFRYPGGCDLLTFVRGPVRDFLVSQAHYEQHGKWPFEPRSHGLAGRLEFYAEQVGSKNAGIGLRVCMLVAAASTSRHIECPCGSGRLLRKCHRAEIRRLREHIPRELAQQILSETNQLTRMRPAERRRWWPTR
jgi:hypothetical protein